MCGHTRSTDWEEAVLFVNLEPQNKRALWPACWTNLCMGSFGRRLPERGAADRRDPRLLLQFADGGRTLNPHHHEYQCGCDWEGLSLELPQRPNVGGREGQERWYDLWGRALGREGSGEEGEAATFSPLDFGLLC